MRTYYVHYDVDWQQTKIQEQIAGLDNWDIIFEGKLIGALRLSFDNDECYLRDLQVSESFQNKGIGAKAIDESIRMAKSAGATKLKLKVFKISPAYKLYKREGFTTISEDDRFYFMEQIIF